MRLHELFENTISSNIATVVTPLDTMQRRITESNYEYVGNCSNSFNSDTGDCDIGIFSDVSDFAYQDEHATQLSRNDFVSLVNLPPELVALEKKYDIKYLAYDNGVLAFYVDYIADENNNRDPNTDIHYFFAK
jgi:hypothetical protein